MPTNILNGLEDLRDKSGPDVYKATGLAAAEQSGIGERTAKLKELDPDKSRRDRGKGGANTAVRKHKENAEKLLEEDFDINYGHLTNSLDLPAIGLPIQAKREIHLLKLDKPTLEKRLGFSFHKGLPVTAKATFLFPAGFVEDNFILQAKLSFEGHEERTLDVNINDVNLVKEYGREVGKRRVAGAIAALREAGKLARNFD